MGSNNEYEHQSSNKVEDWISHEDWILIETWRKEQEIEMANYYGNFTVIMGTKGWENTIKQLQDLFKKGNNE